MNDRLLTGSSFSSDRPAAVGTDSLRLETHRVGFHLARMWRLLLMAVVVVEVPLLLDTYLMHDPDESKFGAISGFNVSLTTICLFLLYFQWLPRLAVESKRVYFNKPLVLFLAIATMTFLWAGDRQRVLFQLAVLFQAFLIFFYFSNNVRNEKELLYLVVLLTVGLFIQSTMMVAAKVLDADISLGPLVFEIVRSKQRVIGSLGSPNVAASCIALLLAPCLSLIFLPVSKKLRLFACWTLVTAGIALVLTYSRGGWLAAAISGSAFMAIASWKGLINRHAFGVLVVVGILFVVAFHQPILNRLTGDDAGSAAARLPLNKASTAMIVENPLGVGANNWDKVAHRHMETGGNRGEWFYVVHNKYLLVCAETGIIGLVVFVSFLLSTIFSGRQTLKRFGKTTSGWIVLGLIAGFFGQSIHMFFDVFNSRAQTELLLLVAALIFAIPNSVHDEARNQVPRATVKS